VSLQDPPKGNIRVGRQKTPKTQGKLTPGRPQFPLLKSVAAICRPLLLQTSKPTLVHMFAKKESRWKCSTGTALSLHTYKRTRAVGGQKRWLRVKEKGGGLSMPIGEWTCRLLFRSSAVIVMSPYLSICMLKAGSGTPREDCWNGFPVFFTPPRVTSFELGLCGLSCSVLYLLASIRLCN
jgi:hypothetical protein